MRKLLIIFPVIAIILFSCQKEVDFLNGSGGGGGGGGTTGNRLVKAVSKSGTDSVVTTYTYNVAGKLVNEKSVGMSGTFDAGNELRYYRNASGILTRFVQINPNFVVAGIDSAVTNVYYNAGTSRYTASVFTLNAFGFTITDSTVLVYDASGKVIRTDEYQNIPLVTMGYELVAKTNYTYDASGGISQMDQYSHDAATSADDLEATYKYTYDTKTNAFDAVSMLSQKNEAMVTDHIDWISTHNISKFDFIDMATPSNNFVFDFVYTYNSNNKPTTVTATQTPGGAVQTGTFTYQ